MSLPAELILMIGENLDLKSFCSFYCTDVSCHKICNDTLQKKHIDSIELQLREGTFRCRLSLLKKVIPEWISGNHNILNTYVMKRFQNFIYPINESYLIDILNAETPSQVKKRGRKFKILRQNIEIPDINSDDKVFYFIKEGIDIFLFDGEWKPRDRTVISEYIQRLTLNRYNSFVSNMGYDNYFGTFEDGSFRWFIEESSVTDRRFRCRGRDFVITEFKHLFNMMVSFDIKIEGTSNLNSSEMYNYLKLHPKTRDFVSSDSSSEKIIYLYILLTHYCSADMINIIKNKLIDTNKLYPYWC